MSIFRAYAVFTYFVTVIHLIAFLMAASVVLCCAELMVICCHKMFKMCFKVGHYWFVMFILAGN